MGTERFSEEVETRGQMAWRNKKEGMVTDSEDEKKQRTRTGQEGCRNRNIKLL